MGLQTRTGYEDYWKGCVDDQTGSCKDVVLSDPGPAYAAHPNNGRK